MPSDELFFRNKQNERLFVSDYSRVRDSCSGVKWFEVNERRGQRLITPALLHRRYRCGVCVCV